MRTSGVGKKSVSLFPRFFSSGIDSREELGIDSRIELGIDSSIESCIESGIDLRIESCIESRMDLIIKSGIDACIESGIDSHIDSGIDPHNESRIDACIESGIESCIESGIDPHIESGIDPHIESRVDFKKSIFTLEFIRYEAPRKMCATTCTNFHRTLLPPFPKDPVGIPVMLISHTFVITELISFSNTTLQEVVKVECLLYLPTHLPNHQRWYARKEAQSEYTHIAYPTVEKLCRNPFFSK